MRVHPQPPGARARSPLLVGLAVLAVALLLDTAVVEAQAGRYRLEEPRLDLDVWAGFYSPKGDLAETNADGVVGGLGLGYALGSHVSLRVEGAFVNLERGNTRGKRLGGVRGPNAGLWHLMSGFEFELTPPRDSDWHVTVSFLGGATRQDVGDPEEGAPPSAGPVEAWVGTFNAHSWVGYDLHRRFRLQGRFGGYVMFGDAADRESSFLGKEAALTMSGGFRIRL